MKGNTYATMHAIRYHYLHIGLNFPFHVANCAVGRSPGNGTIANYTSTVEGSTLLYQCNPGFGPVDEMTAVCAADGSWSPDPAVVSCREIGMKW